MIHFPVIRARRFNIQLRELTMGEALSLAARPAHLEQANTTAFLRLVVAGAADDDPVHWRIGERTLAVAHYIACVLGEPDYQIGTGRYSDYLVPEDAETPDTADLGEIAEERWRLRHLTGRLAEAIERLEVDGLRGGGLWRVGMMAAQMYREGEVAPEAMSDGQLDEWLQGRVTEFIALPESEFEAMMLGFTQGRRALTHLFRIDADDQGLICLGPPPRNREDAGLGPARFPVTACLGAWAQAMARKPA